MSDDGFLPRLRGNSNDDDTVDTINTLETTLERREEQIETLRERVEELEDELAEQDEERPEMVIRSDDESSVPAEGFVSLRESLSQATAMDITPQNADALKSGLEATRAQLDALMEELGIEPVNPSSGMHLDEERHRAVGSVEEGRPAGTIRSVERVGYEHDGTILRRADVVVNGAPTLVDREE